MSPTIAVLPIHERGALYDRGRRSVRCYGLQRGLSPTALACGGAWGEHGARRRRRGESLKSGFLFPIRLGSVAGTGGTAVLLPVLVQYFGIQAAVPMVTLANLAANVSRAVVHGREVDRSVVAWFTLGSLPLSVFGTWLFTVATPEVLTRLLGAFLLAVVA